MKLEEVRNTITWKLLNNNRKFEEEFMNSIIFE